MSRRILILDGCSAFVVSSQEKQTTRVYVFRETDSEKIERARVRDCEREREREKERERENSIVRHISTCVSSHSRLFRLKSASMYSRLGKAVTKASIAGVTTKSMKPICAFATAGLFRSISGD